MLQLGSLLLPSSPCVTLGVSCPLCVPRSPPEQWEMVYKGWELGNPMMGMSPQDVGSLSLGLSWAWCLDP